LKCALHKSLLNSSPEPEFKLWEPQRLRVVRVGVGDK
jgi:hypothetical protein